MSEQEYMEAVESNQGWCVRCKEWTHDCCEPDARGYECPECGGKTVFGAEEALLEQFITITE